MSETVTASDGTPLPLDSLAQEFTYTGALIATISVEYPSVQAPYALTTYVQTFTYDGTNVTDISGWIAQ